MVFIKKNFDSTEIAFYYRIYSTLFDLKEVSIPDDGLSDAFVEAGGSTDLDKLFCNFYEGVTEPLFYSHILVLSVNGYILNAEYKSVNVEISRIVNVIYRPVLKFCAKTVVNFDEKSLINARLADSSNFIIVSNLVFNALAQCNKIMLIYYRPQDVTSYERRGGVELTMMCSLKKWGVKLTPEQLADYSVSSLTKGWNIFLACTSLLQTFNNKNVTLKPIFVEVVGKIDTSTSNTNKYYKPRLVIEKKDHIPLTIPPVELENLEYVNIINRLNKTPKKLCDVVLDRFFRKYKIPGNEKDYVNNPSYAFLHESLWRSWQDLKDVEFFNRYQVDRRFRIYQKNYPINAQLVKAVRYSLTEPKISAIITSIEELALKSKDNECKFDLVKKIKNPLLKNWFDEIKNTGLFHNRKWSSEEWDIIETGVYFSLLGVGSLFEKIKINVTNDDFLSQNSSLIMKIINGEDLENLWKNIEDDEECKAYATIKIIREIKSGVIPLNFMYLDACGSVYQIDALLNSITDETLLECIGLIPSKTSEGVYIVALKSILNKISEDTELNMLMREILNRDVVKKIMMPKQYGMTNLGMKRQLNEAIGEKKLSKHFGEHIESFYKILWKIINEVSEEFGFASDSSIKAVKKIYRSGYYELFFMTKSGFPVILKKGAEKKSSERNRTKKSIAFTHNDKKVRIIIKRDFNNVTYEFSARRTDNGLYVALVHSGDSDVLTCAIIIFVEKTPVSFEVVHDSGATNCMCLGWLTYTYKKAILELAIHWVENNPIIGFIEKDPKLLEITEVKDFYDNHKRNAKKLVKILKQKIFSSERVFY